MIDMLIDDRELARKNGQSSAAIRATELLGKELGMFVDRSDNRAPRREKFLGHDPRGAGCGRNGVDVPGARKAR